MPLDLSPLATPMIIQNKIEDHSAVAAHRDRPLPHPESTTRDDKPSSLPSSTIVHPASLQVPNVLLSTSDASVVIEQALTSPTSSSVITQASSSKRPIVLLSFPVLFQLPNGQTMPVAIPLTIASSVHIPTAVPKLKAVLSQQLPQASEAPPAQHTTTTGGPATQSHQRRPRREEAQVPGTQPSSGVPLQTEEEGLGVYPGEEDSGPQLYERTTTGILPVGIRQR
ncbi:cyclic AMP-dependent transcription factor ATF-2-like [Salvelinus fontinalis]|nr:cyclic AMP-dependent transcription factor ATF-2-like [Salvelinus fontinalis]XP_055727518.1 cyclic AMP-dependent transcription factor ATF-2-like [Salvelinus fontinalis]XP_055727519.1 cyclic AMP-dependent transcription factor ATF-2-like [Salvelinus fontinalis]